MYKMLVNSLQTEKNKEIQSQPLKTNKKYIFFENAYPAIPNISLDDISSIHEIKDYIYKSIPSLDENFIGMRFSPRRNGCLNRPWLEDKIPSDVYDIYVSFYLKKHPRINVNLNK